MTTAYDEMRKEEDFLGFLIKGDRFGTGTLEAYLHSVIQFYAKQE